MNDLIFENKWAWIFLLIPLFLIFWHYFYGKKSHSHLGYHLPKNQENKSLKLKVKPLLPLLPIVSAFLLVLAIAKPTKQSKNDKVYDNGIDIILAMDISRSMLEEDFTPNRLEASKVVAQEFIKKRINDRVGIVVFSGESFVLCPPTIDHGMAIDQVKSIENGIIQDGTAIGMGLASAVRSLQHSKSKSKVVILLTDGVNTTGTIDPYTAIDIAKKFQVKVYTIGIGTPKNNILGIDEPLMRKISSETQGKYYRAQNKQSLNQVYEEINKLETYEIEKTSLIKRKDVFYWFAFPAFLLLLFYIILEYYYAKSLT
ncbi:MAG: VWA domain-containing protein [Chitinophagales bacterium]|jgi:Ca-activated chloride channel family protein|nr:VWA domain-containing protein [Chitinophagales bacterium]